MNEQTLSRRRVMAGIAGLAGGVLFGCSGSDGGSDATKTTRASAPSTDPPPDRAASSETVPPTHGDWPSVDPASAGWDPDRLSAAIAFAGEHNSRSILVLLDGRILAERSFGGPPGFTRDIASAQKSVVSVLAGIAHTRGQLDLDRPVSEYLGQGWSFAEAAAEKRITVHNLLTMTTGLDDGFRPVAAPGKRWDYNNSTYQLVRPVLERVTGKGIAALTRAWLWDPIGVSNNSRWAPRPEGSPASVDAKGRKMWGLTMSARDMGRFGLLVQRGGRWGADVVIPRDELDRALRPSQSMNPAYGELWWLNGQQSYLLPKRPERQSGPLLRSAPADLVAALGAGDQKIYVSRSMRLVVTRLGTPASSRALSLSAFDDQLWRLLTAAAGGR